jgi:short-subunit dehydrogenase
MIRRLLRGRSQLEVVMAKYRKSVGFAIGVAAASAVAGAFSVRDRRKKMAGKVVLITGGSRGFGLALAREFVSLQCDVAICARDHDELTRAQQTLADAHRDVFAVACDITDRDAVSAMVDDVIRHYGRIDVLVNNAGEITVSPFENLDVPDFERAMAVMFWGTLYTTLAVLPLMKSRGQGRIVNVTSIGGKVSVPHLLSYSCAKAAAVAFSSGLRSEVRKFGIQVTTIVPWLMRTGSHVNATFKGNHVAEARWFGAAASLPLLTVSAEHAARVAMKAICRGKAEGVLGIPAQILSRTQILFPGLTADMLRVGNALLPAANTDDSRQTGRDLEEQHGALYHVLTTLGKRAGERLNQPV